LPRIQHIAIAATITMKVLVDGRAGAFVGSSTVISRSVCVGVVLGTWPAIGARRVFAPLLYSAAMSGTASSGESVQAEIDRLRRLVGPDEMSYQDLRTELEAAGRAVRDAEAANGELRATITELRVELRRARQDQYHVWKLLGRPGRLLRALRQSAGPG
jgi:hypothetical protein